MNLEVDYSGSSSRGNGKLRHWLIEQVDCGKYPGLVWENNEKSIFRIPWKHAGKQDYSRDEDAALFKAWALFKGKFREGVDKPDPPTWKTRLRCALNKSNDFEELVDRSQLDISEPYKVYRIIPESAKKRSRQEDNPVSPMSYQVHSYPSLQNQMPQYMAMPECVWRDYCQDQAPLLELPYSQCPCSPRNFSWKGPSLENGYQLRAPIYSCGPAECQPLPFTWDTSIRSAEALSDVRLHVSVYFRDSLMQEVTTSSLKGCHITPFFPEEEHNLPPGGPDVIPLPLDCLTTKRRADDRPQNPFSNLERGVLLWMGVDGLYAHRLCQSRVYWHRGPSTHGNKPNMLEREVTSKLLDTQDYLTGIQSYGLHDRPLPYFQVLLSFGEECLDPQNQRCTLTVQVEPLIARQLLYYAQQTVGHYYHSYDLSGVTEYTNTLDD